MFQDVTWSMSLHPHWIIHRLLLCLLHHRDRTFCSRESAVICCAGANFERGHWNFERGLSKLEGQESVARSVIVGGPRRRSVLSQATRSLLLYSCSTFVLAIPSKRCPPVRWSRINLRCKWTKAVSIAWDVHDVARRRTIENTRPWDMGANYKFQ